MRISYGCTHSLCIDSVAGSSGCDGRPVKLSSCLLPTSPECRLPFMLHVKTINSGIHFPRGPHFQFINKLHNRLGLGVSFHPHPLTLSLSLYLAICKAKLSGCEYALEMGSLQCTYIHTQKKWKPKRQQQQHRQHGIGPFDGLLRLC